MSLCFHLRRACGVFSSFCAIWVNLVSLGRVGEREILRLFQEPVPYNWQHFAVEFLHWLQGSFSHLFLQSAVDSAFFCICKHTLTSLSSWSLKLSHQLVSSLCWLIYICDFFFFLILCTKSLKTLQYRNPLLHGYSELISQRNCTLRRVSVWGYLQDQGHKAEELDK